MRIYQLLNALQEVKNQADFLPVGYYETECELVRWQDRKIFEGGGFKIFWKREDVIFGFFPNNPRILYIALKCPVYEAKEEVD